MYRAFVTGAGGRLGSVIVETLKQRGDDIVKHPFGVNYLVFSHRYRGEPDYRKEIEANLNDVIKHIEGATWLVGDRAIVIVSSIDAERPNINQSLSYNLSKAGLNQLARYYAKSQPIRINTVSPDTFTGDNPKVSTQQVANVIAFLCSPESSGINGQDIKVTG
jgi:NAD(P)-dependent dehydrogenase (short-subunit alcohol dehydrogenase family)